MENFKKPLIIGGVVLGCLILVCLVVKFISGAQVPTTPPTTEEQTTTQDTDNTTTDEPTDTEDDTIETPEPADKDEAAKIMTDEEYATYMASLTWTPESDSLNGADKYFTAVAMEGLLLADETYFVPTTKGEAHTVRALASVELVENVYTVNLNLIGNEPYSIIHVERLENSLNDNLQNISHNLNFMVYYNDKVICNYNTLEN